MFRSISVTHFSVAIGVNSAHLGIIHTPQSNHHPNWECWVWRDWTMNQAMNSAWCFSMLLKNWNSTSYSTPCSNALIVSSYQVTLLPYLTLTLLFRLRPLRPPCFVDTVHLVLVSDAGNYKTQRPKTKIPFSLCGVPRFREIFLWRVSYLAKPTNSAMTRFRPVVALRLFLAFMTCSRQMREATSFFLMPHSSQLRTIKFPLHHPQQRQQQQRRVPFSSSLAAAPIVDQVTDEMKVAMKAKDATTLSTVRLIRSAFSNACIELQVPQLDDEQVPE